MYFNIDQVCDAILDKVRADAVPPGAVIPDLSAAPRMDLQSAHALGVMASEIRGLGIALRAVEARSSVPDRLRDEGFEETPGGINRFTSVAGAVQDFRNPKFDTTE